MTEIGTVDRVPITEDYKRLCDICEMVGYLGGVCELKHGLNKGTEYADHIAQYISELFNAKREVVPYRITTNPATAPAEEPYVRWETTVQCGGELE